MVLLLILIFQTTFLGFDFLISKVCSSTKQFNQLLAYHISYYIITFIVLQYSCMVYAIDKRIIRLNQYLLHTLSKSERGEPFYVSQNGILNKTKSKF